MTRVNRRACLSLALTAAGVLAANGSRAQEVARWPTRPVRLLIAFAPGGFTDIAGRVLSQSLSTVLGQPVVVENRPGAAGLIGTEAAAQAAPDGYTLLLGTISTHAINVGLYKQLPYDALKSFVPVSGVASGQLVLAAHPSVDATGIAGLIALARARPGVLTYGSGGNGTTSHLAGELFKSMAGVDLLHVPFRSPAPAASALLAGQVDVMFDTVPTALPQIRQGRLRALGVSSTARVPELPDVPPVADTLPGFETGTWVGLFAPAGTPAAIIEQVDAATRQVLLSPETANRLSELGMQPLLAGPGPFAEYQRQEIGKWVRVIQSAGIKPD